MALAPDDTGFSINMNRFDTTEAYVWNYGDKFLVECPNCASCGHVITLEQADIPSVRLLCKSCGNAKEWKRTSCGVTYSNNFDYFENGEVSIGAAVDWYFHLPLWLQVPCKGENLWAYNSNHLNWLKGFVSAKLRERKPSKKYGWSNQSLASRLPKWLKKASNREQILLSFPKLEKKLHQYS